MNGLLTSLVVVGFAVVALLQLMLMVIGVCWLSGMSLKEMNEVVKQFWSKPKEKDNE